MTTTERTCPKCGSAKVLPIRYGLPAFGSEPPGETYVDGGCFIDEGSPQWACAQCQARWRESETQSVE
jgi:hypothetical protein